MISRERIESIRDVQFKRGAYYFDSRQAKRDVADLLAALDQREALLAAAYAELCVATSRGAKDVQNWIADLLRGSRFEVK